MNSSPKNLPSQDNNSQAIKSDEPLNNLLNFLLAEKSSAYGLPQAETAEGGDTNSKQPSYHQEKAFDSTLEESKSEQINSDADNSSFQHTEESNIEIDVESEIENLTLQKAFEYQAFLQQTVEPKQQSTSDSEPEPPSSWEVTFDEATELAKDSAELQTQPGSSKELDVVDSVNSLIPLMVELLKYKIDDSQETIIKAVSPVLDRIIEQRSLEDSPKMAAAIAKILPHAITKGINLTPEEIAKAIAPELALCIKEQIRLDQDASRGDNTFKE